MTNDKQRERLVELLIEYDTMRMMRHSIVDCADRLLAKGVIVPPCMVGDTVWANKGCFHLPYTSHGKIIPCEVIAIKETKKGKCILLKPLLIETYGMRRVNAWFPFSSIGKTVFATKEEAEAKLKEGVQG